MRAVEGLRGTAMVTKGGSVEADLAEGLADVEAGVTCTPGTQFQICSVSKQFTATAVMLLVESGRLDLGSRSTGGCLKARRSGGRSRSITCCPIPRASRTGSRRRAWTRPSR